MVGWLNRRVIGWQDNTEMNGWIVGWLYSWIVGWLEGWMVVLVGMMVVISPSLEVSYQHSIVWLYWLE